MDDLKVFSKEDVFGMMVDVIINITGYFALMGMPKADCFTMLDRITNIANGTLVHTYNFTPEEIKSFASLGLLGMHTFTAADKEN